MSSVEIESYSVPEWLTNEFLDEHLRKYFGNNELRVFNFEAAPATKKGENFASTITRVHVIYSVPSKGAPSTKKDVSVDLSKEPDKIIDVRYHWFLFCIKFVESTAIKH